MTPRRALLFMPGDDRRKIEKGIAAAPDAVIMDLEDGVAFNRKAEARAVTADALKSLHFNACEKIVRINPVGSGLEADDLAAVLPSKPQAIIVPKVESAQQVHWVRRQCPSPLPLIALIETARGVVYLPEIAACGELAALAFGAEDFVGSMGGVRTPTMHEAAYARSAVAVHAAAFSLMAIDTPFVNLQADAEPALRAETRAALELGYHGKFAIHPKQIAPITETFTPSASEVAQAQRLLQAYARHQAGGAGVFAMDGKMVDAPMIRAAQAVLARAGLK